MLNCIDVKFNFDSVRLDLSSSVNILQIADGRMAPSELSSAVFAMFLAIILPSSSCSSYSWNDWSVRQFGFRNETSQSSPQVISSLNTKFFQIWSSVTGYGELFVCF